MKRAIGSALGLLLAAAAAAPAYACSQPWQKCVTLGSGQTFMFEYSWSMGELMIFLGLVVLTALYVLRWIVDYRRGFGL
jgi:hypothetical protein